MHRNRKGGPMSVDEIESLLRGMVASNVDNIQYYDGDKKNDLLRENEILNAYLDKLPKFLTKAEIRDILIEKEEEIKSHEKEGGAKGIAFRLLKSKDCKVLGEDVNEVVDEMRS